MAKPEIFNTQLTETQISDAFSKALNSVQKEEGKQLSENSFSNEDRAKLASLENYDDTDIKVEVAKTAEQSVLNRSTLGYRRKNLLMNNCQSTTRKGVTATVNEDGSITLTGSNTSSGAFIIYWNMQTGTASTTLEGQYAGNKKWIPNGKYIVSGGNAKATVQVYWSADNNSDNQLAASMDGSEQEFEVTDTHKYVWSRLLIRTGADFSTPLTIYPMIRPAEITDDTYEPYKPSVEERLAALEAAVMGGGVT